MQLVTKRYLGWLFAIAIAIVFCFTYGASVGNGAQAQTVDRLKIAGSVSDWSRWLTDNGFTATSGLYAKAVVVESLYSSEPVGSVADISDKSVISADGSFAVELQEMPDKYLTDTGKMDWPAGISTDPESGVSTNVDNGYEVAIWIFDSSGNHVSEIVSASGPDEDTTVAAGKTYVRNNYNYATAPITISGSFKPEPGMTVTASGGAMRAGWNYEKYEMTKRGKHLDISYSGNPASGLKFYATPTKNRLKISSAVDNWKTWSASNGIDKNSGAYVQAVLVNEENGTVVDTISERSPVAADGSFAMTMEPMPQKYLTDLTAAATALGLTATPKTGVYGNQGGTAEVNFYLYDSADKHIGSIGLASSATPSANYTSSEPEYVTGDLKLTGNFTNDAGVLVNVDAQYHYGYQYQVLKMSKTKGEQHLNITYQDEPPAGLKYYASSPSAGE